MIDELPIELIVEILKFSGEDPGLLSYVCKFWKDIVDEHIKLPKFDLTKMNLKQILSFKFNNDRLLYFALSNNNNSLINIILNQPFSFKAIKHYFQNGDLVMNIVIEKDKEFMTKANNINKSLFQNQQFINYFQKPKLYKCLVKNTTKEYKLNRILSFIDSKQILLIFELIIYSIKINHTLFNDMILKKYKIDEELWRCIPQLLKEHRRKKSNIIYKELTSFPTLEDTRKVNDIISTTNITNIYSNSNKYIEFIKQKVKNYAKFHNNKRLRLYYFHVVSKS